jgi:predicted ester cyclase
MISSAFPDIQITDQDFIAEGDRVVYRWNSRFTHQSEFMGIPPTGKPVTLTGIDVYRLADGKVVEHWGEVDMLGLMQQLAVIAPSGQGGR